VVEELIRSARIAWTLERAAVRAQVQYRANFLSMIVLGIVYQGSGFAFVLVVMHNVDLIAGWSLGDIAFLYGLRMLAHALWIVPLSHLWMLDQMAREAEFDRYLLRPLSPFVQFVTSKFQMNALGDACVAVLILGYSLTLVDANFDPWTLLLLGAAVIGGALIEGSIQVAVAAFAIRTLNTMALRMLADLVFSIAGSYPVIIFPKLMQVTLTVLPVSFVAYFPAALALGRQDELFVPLWVAHLTLPVGVVLFLAAGAVWRSQLRHYQSAGN
jgi:ABC-2 type transport system permease protein